jgi:outer membrane lipoprotein-sorting protein
MSQVRKSARWPALIACLFATGPRISRAADADEIVQRAAAALNSDWAADPSYACVEKDEVQKGDKVTSKTFEVVMIDGSDYRFPLAINGQPLSPARRKAELVKLKNEIERRENESPSARRSRIAAWKKQRDENGELLLDFPTALTFQLVGEQMTDGREAYVFSATPKPGVVPATRAAKVLTGIQGKAWVDKETMHPIRVECSVIKPVPVYGALASVLPGTDIEIGMTNVADSTWLIDTVSMKLKVAKLRVFKSTDVTRYTYTGYSPNTSALEKLLSEAGHE